MSSREFDLTPAAKAGRRAALLPGGNLGSQAAATARTGAGRLNRTGAALRQLQRLYSTTLPGLTMPLRPSPSP